MKRWLGGREQKDDGTASERFRMVQAQLKRRGIRQQEVLDALNTVPRERFVAPDMAAKAYDDSALPIGGGQTISQPYIVALMTQALDLPGWRQRHAGQVPRVLDVGTGSGYQAAVLAELGADVVSIERDPQLAAQAQQLLNELKYNVQVAVGDGSLGAPELGPYAAIVVAAAAPDVPDPLVKQLLPDGRLVLPIGSRTEQQIVLVRPIGTDRTVEHIEQAVFVPLLGEHGFGSGD